MVAVAAVGAADPVMRGLIEQVGPCLLARRRGDDHFGALVRAIVFQQLAGAAAATIHGRVLVLFGGSPTPEAVLAAPKEALRGVGLSANKAAAVRDLAMKVAHGEVELDGIERLADEEVIGALTSVRGIGRWTAQMFLIFRLRRLDVWPVGDYGVRKGYALSHRLAELPSPGELDAAGERYRPYRTVAAWYLWRAVDRALLPGGPQAASEAAGVRQA